MIDNPRLRLTLATQSRRIVVVLAVLAAVLLLLAGWTALTPATETVPEDVDRTQFTTAVDHSAVVQTEDSPWPRGTTLENHPAYLLDASPRLDLAVTTDAPSGATVVHDVRLQLRVEREGRVVWEETEQLARSEQTAEDGQATTETTVDVQQISERTTQIEEQFAGLGSVSATIVADASYQTDRYDGTLTVESPLTTTGNFYWLSGDGSASEIETERQTVERQAPVDWSWVLGLLLLGLTSAGGAVAAWRYDEQEDVAALRHRLHRQQFEEWISSGSVPPIDPGRDSVSLDSLPDLVDVAIDSSSRVVYDEQQSVYAVYAGDVVYYYARGDARDRPTDAVASGGFDDATGGPFDDGAPGDDFGDDDSTDGADDGASSSDSDSAVLDPFDDR